MALLDFWDDPDSAWHKNLDSTSLSITFSTKTTTLSSISCPQCLIFSSLAGKTCRTVKTEGFNSSRRKLFFIFLLAQDLRLAVRTAQIWQWYLSWSFLESVNKQTWGWSRRVRLHVTCAISHLNEWVCHGNEDHQLFSSTFFFFNVSVLSLMLHCSLKRQDLFYPPAYLVQPFGQWSGDIYFYDGVSHSCMHQDSSYRLLNK